MDTLETTRKRILELVGQYAREKFGSRPFAPDRDLVHYAGRVFDGDELRCATEAVLDFFLTANRFAESFEADFADYFGAPGAYLVNSGSSANLVALTALTSPKLGDRRLRPGDEVITVAAGFPTTLAPILQNGLVPVFVDVGIGDYTAIAERVAEAVGPRTRAVMMAHTMGNPFDLDAVMAVVRKHGLWLIEDNCDALGSTYRGRLTGTFGHLATFSFYPAHHITMGEGGCVVAGGPEAEELGRIVRSVRDWGRDCYCAGGENNTCGKRFSQQFGTLPLGFDHKYVYSHIGYNLKLTDIQAAVGCAQWRKLPDFIARRKANFATLRKALAPYEDRLVLPTATPGSDPAWFGFVITVREGAGFSRTELQRHLEEQRVETRALFAGNLLRHPAFLDIPHRVCGGLANTDRITESTFFVGVYPGLDAPRLEHMAEAFRSFLQKR
ncbi:MAG: lipopolysaccharide biosynthesis protein RfbH [Elusimicrobia bacterium]|nr:lipopolysaccharide biosynthesis protein RfbH [Elusimicrobiota bacterium]